jgi:hypothetical protein
VAIDPIAGGAKVTSQATALDWPLLLAGDRVDSEQIALAIQQSKTQETRELIEKSQKTAAIGIERIKNSFQHEIANRLEM